MPARLGEKLGEGATAEVFAWDDQRVIKLSRPGVGRQVCEYEAMVTRAVTASGAPAPEVFDVVEVDGRLGIIYPRYSGESLLRRLLRGEVTPTEAGKTMAAVHWSLHGPQFQAQLPSLRTSAMRALEQLGRGRTPPDVIELTRSVVLSLPENGSVCHGDLHLDNIFITDNGPVILDWTSALNASPLVDVARQSLSLTVLPIEDARSIARRFQDLRGEVYQAYLSGYARCSSQESARLEAAVAPFTVVMAALRMAEPVCTTLEREVLVRYIRANARQERPDGLTI